MHLKVALLLFILSAFGYEEAAAQSASTPESESVSQVWRREADYWRFVAAGDAESYESLWHDRFIGWPCGLDHPKRKASIGNWVREIREKHIQVVSNITREGAEDFGNVVVVHYRLTRVATYPDGKVEGRGKESKITHTWMKVGESWLIIAGMCGVLPDSAR
jgi:hypothetical protein